MFNDLVQQIVSVLRYIASPIVGLTVAFLIDDEHGILKAVMTVAWPWSGPPSTWLIAGFLGVVGVTVYFAHRTIFHGLVSKYIVMRHARKLSLDLTADTLAFARWERRGAEDHTDKQSTQTVLDESNASIHFFYCSGWSAILFALIFRSVFPNNYQPTIHSWFVFGLIVIGLFATALIGDSRAARLDIDAYLRYKEK
jgi:hypothetical protein